MKKIKTIFGKLFLKKIFVSLVIVLVYLLGLQVAFSGMGQSITAGSASELDLLAVIAYDPTKLSLFSLGLGPWFFVSILQSFIFFNQNQSPSQKNMISNLLLLGVSLFQANHFLSVPYMSRLPIAFQGQSVALLSILVAGVFVLKWLSDMNAQYGIGGMSLLILVSIIKRWLQSLQDFIGETLKSPHAIWILIGVYLFLLGLLFINVFLGKAQTKLPLNRTMISSKHYEDSYLGIKFLPASYMPLMYVSGVLLMISTLLTVVPKIFGIAPLNWNIMDLRDPLKLLFYALLIFGLTFLFAYLNLNPKQIAKNMQVNGEYFDFVRPGKATERYIRYFLTRQNTIAGLFLVVYVCLPYIVAMFVKIPVFVVALPTTIAIVVGMLLTIDEQLLLLQIDKRYKKKER